MADSKKPTSDQKLEGFMSDFYQANLDKNNGQSRERKAEQAALKEYGQRNAPYEFKLSDNMTLVAGHVTTESEEIDPRKLFERDPTAFWELVNVPKVNAIERLGEKVVAQISVPVKTTKFKIQKVKS